MNIRSRVFLKALFALKGNLRAGAKPRPPRNTSWAGDWYMHDPCTNYHEDPLWYAPDLIAQILESRVPHEIGTHSFSHIDFSPACSNATLVRRELEESAIAMRRFGVTPRSLEIG